VQEENRKKRFTSHRIISLLLLLSFVFSLIPVSAQPTAWLDIRVDITTDTAIYFPIKFTIPYSIQLVDPSSGVIYQLYPNRVLNISTQEYVTAGSYTIDSQNNRISFWIGYNITTPGNYTFYYRVIYDVALMQNATVDTVFKVLDPNKVWIYRVPITVTNNLTSALSDYQVFLYLNLSSQVSAGKIRSDLGDIRFKDSVGNELSYWIENNTASAARIWVKVPSIPASGSTTIYIYYGNPSATTTSNRTLTFVWYYDFENGNYNNWTFSVFSSGDTYSLETTTPLQGSYSLKENQVGIGGGYGYVKAFTPSIPGYNYKLTVMTKYSGYTYLDSNSGIGLAVLYYNSSGSLLKTALWFIYTTTTPEINGDWNEGAPTTVKVTNWQDAANIIYTHELDIFGNAPTDASSIKIKAQIGNTNGKTLWTDCYVLRKYISPEPSHGSWGTEETDVSTVLQTSEYTVAEYNSTHWVITIPDATINSKGTSYQLYTTATCAIYDLKMGDDSTFPVYLPLNSPMNFKAILKDPYGNPIQQSATFMIMDSQNKILGTNTTTSDSSGIALASVTTPSSAGAYYIRANTTGNYVGLLYNTIKVTDIDHSTSFNDERTWIWDASTLSGYAYYTVDYTSLPGKVTINGTDVTLSGGQFSKAVQSSTVGNFSYVLTFNDTKYVTKTTTVYHIFDYPKVTPSFDSNGNVYFAVISTFDNSSLPFAYSVDSDKATLGSFQYGLKSFTWNVLTRNYGDKTFKITTDANSTIVVTSADPSLRKIIFNATGPANVTVWVGSIGKPYQVKVDGAVVNFIWDDASKTLIVPITSTTVELDFPAPPEEGMGGGGIIWTPTVPSPSDTSTTPPASTVPPSVGASPEIVKFGLFAIVLAGVAALVAKEVQERAKLSYKFKAAFRPKKITKKDWDKARKKKWWG